MIKINKDTSDIPDSLQLPFKAFFQRGVPLPSKTTHKRRMELIENEKYIYDDKYNYRYKQDDTKIKLKNIYHNKCAYCEQIVEQLHVEHYRPKTIYYWFAFSWDNLILACPTCNQNKGIHFDLLGVFKNFDNTEENVNYIHNYATKYDLEEKPKMVNPEVTEPLGKIEFQKDGLIKSSDTCFAYTIDKCKIDRIYLNDERRKLIDIFRRDIVSVFADNFDAQDLRKVVNIILTKFIRDSQDCEMQFLAFRRFAISSNWLNDIVKELN